MSMSFLKEPKLSAEFLSNDTNRFGLHYFGEELSGPEYAARFIELVEAEI
jgi:hypothetical protein